MRGLLASLLAGLVLVGPLPARAAGPTRALLQPAVIASWGPSGVAIARLHSGSFTLAAPVILGYGGNYSSGGGGVTSASMIDPYVPVDGTMNVTGAIQASTSMTIGSTNFYFTSGAGGGISNSNNSLYAYGNVADGASAVGVILNNGVTLANAGAKIVSVRNNGSEKAYFDLNGALTLGSVTIANVAAPTRIQSNGAALVLQGGTPGDVRIQEPGTAGAIALFTDNGSAGEMTHGFGNGSAGLVYAGGTLNVNTTAVGNVGAGTDDLMTYSLPANSLIANARGVHFKTHGTAANNAAAKTLTCNFGSQVVLTNVFTVSLAETWEVEGWITRTGSSTQDWKATFLGNTGVAGAFVYDPESGTATQTDTGALTIKCTGTATSDNDIVQEFFLIEAY